MCNRQGPESARPREFQEDGPISSASSPQALTTADVVRDLEAGRSLPLRPADRLQSLRTRPRPTVPGPAFLLTYLTARALGRVHPRLARRPLLRLWFTPWVHPSALKPVADVADDLVAWSLRSAGTTLHGYAGGRGSTVVLVHGWAGRAADWRHLARDLIAGGWRVVVPDLPAHGMTAGRRTDLFELGRALARVLDHERPVAVVAHSMGFPATLRAIAEGARAPATIVALAPGRTLARAVDGFAARARLRPALVEQLRRGVEGRYGAGVWDVLDADRVLPGLNSRGVVIHDADDEEVPVTDGRGIAEHWPQARFTATAGLGHRRILRDESVRALVVEALS